ncbi:MAG: hypothetical protein ACR2RV_10970 [Verrucomicrobiales bacterium]
MRFSGTIICALSIALGTPSVVAGMFSERRVEIEAAVDKGLACIAKRQMADGNFPGQYGSYPGVAGLVGMAFLSMGHMPGEGEYGEILNRCVDYVLASQAGSGVFAEGHGRGNMYSHCLSTLFLSEISGSVDVARQEKIHVAVAKGLNIILRAQAIQKSRRYQGGWRYQPTSADSDLSVSGWALMALRSARLNGAPVPDKAIDSAIRYVIGMFNRNDRMFGYSSNSSGTPSMTAVGILCLELTGKHGHPIIEPASRAILAQVGKNHQHHHSTYANYYMAQSMFQVGGEHWEEYAAWMYPHYLKSQNTDGSWGMGSVRAGDGDGAPSGSVYDTAMTLLALSVPFRQLPIYQRDAVLEEEDEKSGRTDP